MRRYDSDSNSHRNCGPMGMRGFRNRKNAAASADVDRYLKHFDESKSLSDIDDREVDGYLYNEEEKHYKKIIWEEMNREYLEEQAAKEAAAAAAKEAFEANFQNCSDDLLAASAAATVAKSRKEKKQRRAPEAKNSGPAQSAGEATRQMLMRKRLSSKVNYDVLEKLFDESAPPEKPKKVRIDVPSEDQDNKEPNTADKNKDNELGSEDDGLEDGGDTGGTYETTFFYENMEQTYDYEGDDYGDDGY